MSLTEAKLKSLKDKHEEQKLTNEQIKKEIKKINKVERKTKDKK